MSNDTTPIAVNWHLEAYCNHACKFVSGESMLHSHLVVKGNILIIKLTTVAARFQVVADGPNLIHTNVCLEHKIRLCKECYGKCSDYQDENFWDLTFDCINAENLVTLCEKRGYKLTIWMKRGTWNYAYSERKNPEVDFDILDRLESNDIIDVQQPTDEDLYWVQLALDTDAWIVTGDKLRKERARFPEGFDWEDVVSRLIEPTLSPRSALKSIVQRLVIPQSQLPMVSSTTEDIEPIEGDSNEIRLEKELANERLIRIANEKTIRSLTTKLRTAEGGLTDEEKEYEEVICSVWVDIVSKDAWTHCTELYFELVRRIVNCDPKETSGDDWKKEFRFKLGYSETVKTSTILEDHMIIVKRKTGRHPKFNPNRTKVKFLD